MGRLCIDYWDLMCIHFGLRLELHVQSLLLDASVEENACRIVGHRGSDDEASPLATDSSGSVWMHHHWRQIAVDSVWMSIFNAFWV